ncbi:hypothetical protein M6G63_18730 [Pseudomonas sp. BYT-5]|uniref:hypothetical protein n=1 Tax=unclassified Pseudomonas TaxID=196821 RepID=UPI0020207025|nr:MULTISPECIES: hypothetical protein [unclassified Pseudomonas]URD41461.1 hypothetical protein M6G63_18730 [Pseudomonas sp. BYT-5]URK96812.1 hypothetical protein J5X93_19395 [Pseudomonas sp. BYT-1]
MNNPSTPPQALQQGAGATIISGPWPTYAQFKGLPDRDRWVLYGSAKAYRAALEDQGLVMSESYDQFVRRVTEELEL